MSWEEMYSKDHPCSCGKGTYTEVISLYDLAWSEMENIKSLISTNNFELIRLSNNHKETLSKRLK